MKAKLVAAVLALSAVSGGMALAGLEKPTCKPEQIDTVELGQECAGYHRAKIADLKAEVRRLRND